MSYRKEATMEGRIRIRTNEHLCMKADLVLCKQKLPIRVDQKHIGLNCERLCSYSGSVHSQTNELI
jgi:hypothetical protein